MDSGSATQTSDSTQSGYGGQGVKANAGEESGATSILHTGIPSIACIWNI
jgi:hypothetical protein